MFRSLRRAVAMALASVAAATMALVLAPAAHAATGTVSLNPATGYITGAPNLVPSGGCSLGSSAYTMAFLSGGPSNWDPETYVWKAPSPVAQGFGVSLSLISFANEFALTMKTGVYDIEFICTDRDLTQITDTYMGKLQITIAGSAPASSDTYAIVDTTPASSVSTPVANPSSGVVAGTTNVQLSTTVTATGLASGVTASGSVQFQADGVNIGSPVTVSGLTNASAGVTVSQTVQFASAGTKAVTAVFTPDSASVVKAGTSSALSLTVAAAPVGPVATTLSLTASATSISTLDTVVLKAVATAANGTVPTGTVTFTNGSTSLGTATLDATGSASLGVAGATLGAGGPYSLGASLAASSAYGASTAVPVSLTVTTPSTIFSPAPSGQTIQVSVPAGTVTVSGGVTAASGNITLGFPGVSDGGVQKYALQLNSGNTLLTNSGAAVTNGHNQLYRLLVTDTRSGNTGYTVTGVVTNNFVSGSNIIDSAVLGWTPRVSALCASGVLPSAPTFGTGTGAVGTGYESTVSNAGNDCSQVAAVAGAAVDPGTPGTVGGLKTARTLFSTTSGNSNGTVSVTADLLLNAPTTTKPGYYTSNLTLTALSN